MPEIKTRDYAARTVRSMNRVHNLSARMKSDMVRGREDQIDEKQYAVETTEHGAAEMLPHAAHIGIRNRKAQEQSDMPESVTKNTAVIKSTQAETKKSQVTRSSTFSERQAADSRTNRSGNQIKNIHPRSRRATIAIVAR